MEKPTEKELAAALTLAENCAVTSYCDMGTWSKIVGPMFPHVKTGEKPLEAAARILAQAYRATLADLNSKE